MAELAAWKISKKDGFKMCSILPSFVIGPPCTDRKDGVSINFGLNLIEEGSLGLTGIHACMSEM
jgi:hypothetical protein